MKKKPEEDIKDILIKPKADRRVLSYVPDKNNIRKVRDRRGGEKEYGSALYNTWGTRYEAELPCIIYAEGKNKTMEKCTIVDISTGGVLVKLDSCERGSLIKETHESYLKFTIEKGAMPEGYEMDVKIKAQCIRRYKESGTEYAAFMFMESLASYADRKKNRYMISFASAMLFIVTFVIILMRAESIIYFRFNRWLYLYSILAAVFLLSRYYFGARYRPVEVDSAYTPGVTIIVPCFNEEKWIGRTIISCINQDYPIDKLQVIVVDDCSSDKSVEAINRTIEDLKEKARDFQIRERLSCIAMEKNQGKRHALCEGVLKADHDLIVFVDSDSFLDPFAIRHLVQPFRDPAMGGVSGRTDVANTYTNSLTKMQSVRYYIAFRIMKAAESYFDAVTCLSGPLACYKKEIITDNMEEWLNQSFLGQRATFGDDRAMTNFVLRHHRTGYQDTAVCSTIVPNEYSVFLKQQMRWKRSWLRESIIAGSFMWRKEPFMAVLFYMGVLVPILAPIVVTYNLIYVPLAHRVFPTTFLIGIILMSFLMSFAQMLLRTSTTWIFGFIFCIYYEGVLLWQMPIAWVTFWKSTWGTRMTPSDVEAEEKKKNRRDKRREGKP